MVPLEHERGLPMKVVAFYSVLSLPIIAWGLIVLPWWLKSYEIPAAVVYAAIMATPLIAGDMSIVGEITPVILAGAIIALLPNSSWQVKVSAVLLAIITYILYIQLSIFFSGAGQGLIGPEFSDISRPKMRLLSLISNVRVTAIVVAASLIGLKLRNEA